MNTRLLILSLVSIALISGCGKGPSTSSEPHGDTAAASANGGARTIEITANDQMKYSTTALQAKPGEELHVVLTNIGSVPKEAMAHNWVLLKPGSDVMAFSAAAAGAKEQNYIPDSLKDQIIAKIDILGPHQTGEVTFKAPDQPGEYPYLCSFPGHAALMKGVLTVH
jgi:azurin